MNKKKMIFPAASLVFAVLVFSNVSKASVPQLKFNTLGPLAGDTVNFLVSYGGDGGPLVGSTIPIAEVKGDFTYAKPGVSLYIVNGSLDFSTGDNKCEVCLPAYPDDVNYQWYPHFGKYTLTGTILKEGITPATYTGSTTQELFSGEILKGIFVCWPDITDYPFISDALGSGTNVFWGVGLDEMAEPLASFYGFSHNTFQSQISMTLCVNAAGDPPPIIDPNTKAYSCNNGTGSILSILMPYPDSDGDGIENSIDNAPTTFSDTFTDSNTPLTSGEITDRGGLRLAVTDEIAPDGVFIKATASCGSNPATVSVCGGSASFTLNDGNKVLVTCGSVTIKNLSEPGADPVEVIFKATDGSEAITSVASGDSIAFEPTTFTIIAPLTNTAPTVVSVDGEVFTIEPGESWDHHVIIKGCDSGVVNEAYEGQYISRWINDCASNAKNHGKFVSCVAHLTNDLKKAGLITGSEKGSIQSCAAQADLP